jgi:hypothetical protein
MSIISPTLITQIATLNPDGLLAVAMEMNAFAQVCIEKTTVIISEQIATVVSEDEFD